MPVDVTFRGFAAAASRLSTYAAGKVMPSAALMFRILEVAGRASAN